MHNRRRPSWRGNLNRIHSRGGQTAEPARAARMAGATEKFLDVIDNHLVILRLHREISVGDFGMKQALLGGRRCSASKTGRAFSSSNR